MRHSYDATMPITAPNGATLADLDLCIDYSTHDGEIEIKDVTGYGWRYGKMIAAPLPHWLDARARAYAETLTTDLQQHAAEDYAAAAAYADDHGDWLHEQRKDAALEAHG